MLCPLHLKWCIVWSQLTREYFLHYKGMVSVLCWCCRSRNPWNDQKVPCWQAQVPILTVTVTEFSNLLQLYIVNHKLRSILFSFISHQILKGICGYWHTWCSKKHKYVAAKYVAAMSDHLALLCQDKMRQDQGLSSSSSPFFFSFKLSCLQGQKLDI